MNKKEIYINLKHCLENNIKISKSLLYNYIYLLLDKYELNKEVDKLCLSCDNDDANGFYDNETKKLVINYERIIKDYDDELFNMKLLNTTFHELTHVCQFNIYNNPSSSFCSSLI